MKYPYFMTDRQIQSHTDRQTQLNMDRLNHRGSPILMKMYVLNIQTLTFKHGLKNPLGKGKYLFNNVINQQLISILRGANQISPYIRYYNRPQTDKHQAQETLNIAIIDYSKTLDITHVCYFLLQGCHIQCLSIQSLLYLVFVCLGGMIVPYIQVNKFRFTRMIIPLYRHTAIGILF